MGALVSPLEFLKESPQAGGWQGMGSTGCLGLGRVLFAQLRNRLGRCQVLECGRSGEVFSAKVRESLRMRQHGGVPWPMV